MLFDVPAQVLAAIFIIIIVIVGLLLLLNGIFTANDEEETDKGLREVEDKHDSLD